MTHYKNLLLALYRTAVRQALPEVCLPPYLRGLDGAQGIRILGAGKASVQMAEVAQQVFGDACDGAIVTRHGYTDKAYIGKIKVLNAGHPVPDEGSLQAAQQLLALAQQTPKNKPVLFLISGGGSALMSLPLPGLAFSEKMAINRFLLGSGASIDEINTVRKQLSAIKGGKLAEAVAGDHHTLIISDVVGDVPGLIASGPTVADDSTPAQALAILAKYRWPRLASLETLLADKAATHHKAPLSDNNVHIIANAHQSIDEAVALAQEKGWPTQVLSYDQQGDAAETAKEHARIALELLDSGHSCILFSGGELTVTLNNPDGAGGPNQEYLLALAIALDGAKGICAIACDTDGVDGNRDVAGAYIDEQSINRARALSLDPGHYLANNLSHDFFAQLDDLIVTGPTHTNVNDFRAILIEGRDRR